MTTDDPVLQALARVNPEPDPSASAAPEADRLLSRILGELEPPRPDGRRRHAATRILVPLASVAVVAAVIAVVARVGVSGPEHHHPTAASGSARIVLRAEPTPQVGRVTAAALRQEVTLLTARLRTMGVAGVQIGLPGNDQIVVTVPAGTRLATLTRALTARPHFDIYDWEANVLTTSGRPAAAGLGRDNATVLTLSQGAAHVPGTSSSGGSTLYAAVRLASSRPPAATDRTLSRLGPEYYLFQDARTPLCPGATPCYLGGPAAHRSALPAGGAGARTRVLAVPQGTIVVQAAGQTVPVGAPSARFYVLRDRVAVDGRWASEAAAGHGPNGGGAVYVQFRAAGRVDFYHLTRSLAHRGERLSIGAAVRAQHLAIVLDGRLLSVAAVDYREYPDGAVPVPGQPVELVGDLSGPAAQALAGQLRLGLSGLRLVPASSAG